MKPFRSNVSEAPTTILTEKQSQLAMLQRDSENAVGVITETITRLENVNQQIAERRSEIEQYQNELTYLNGAMVDQFNHNKKLVEKFKSFLED